MVAKLPDDVKKLMDAGIQQSVAETFLDAVNARKSSPESFDKGYWEYRLQKTGLSEEIAEILARMVSTMRTSARLSS